MSYDKRKDPQQQLEILKIAKKKRKPRVCPNCGHDKFQGRSNSIKSWRICLRCGHKFGTYTRTSILADPEGRKDLESRTYIDSSGEEHVAEKRVNLKQMDYRNPRKNHKKE